MVEKIAEFDSKFFQLSYTLSNVINIFWLAVASEQHLNFTEDI